MRYTYDADVDALIIDLQPGTPVARTVEIDEARHVDLDDAERVVTIEILWASTGVKVDDVIEQFQLEDYKAFLQDVADLRFKPRVSV